MACGWLKDWVKACATAVALLCVGMAVHAQEVIETTPPDDTLRVEKEVLIDSLESVSADTRSLVLADSLAQRALETVDSLQAQVGDRLQKKERFVPDPKRALWMALIFPGGGQIYNRKYWKLPVIYGGFLGCYYALSWNNQMLRDYSQAYLDIMDADPNTKSYEKMLPMNYSIAGRESQFQEIFKNKKNYYRKYRDMSILAFFAVYAIAVIDAYVDAELSTFDISEDLSLQWTPAVVTTTPTTSRRQSIASPASDRGLGVALRLNF